MRKSQKQNTDFSSTRHKPCPRSLHTILNRYLFADMMYFVIHTSDAWPGLWHKSWQQISPVIEFSWLMYRIPIVHLDTGVKLSISSTLGRHQTGSCGLPELPNRQYFLTCNSHRCNDSIIPHILYSVTQYGSDASEYSVHLADYDLHLISSLIYATDISGGVVAWWCWQQVRRAFRQGLGIDTVGIMQSLYLRRLRETRANVVIWWPLLYNY